MLVAVFGDILLLIKQTIAFDLGSGRNKSRHELSHIIKDPLHESSTATLEVRRNIAREGQPDRQPVSKATSNPHAVVSALAN